MIECRFPGTRIPIALGVMVWSLASGPPLSASMQREPSTGLIQPVEVGEVGCASCGDFRLLSNVLSLTLGAGDTLYVLDATRPKVRAFRRSGRRIGSAITEGREPGQAVLPVGAVFTDTLAVLVDGALDRITVYRRDWTYVNHYQLDVTPVSVAHRAPYAHFFVASVRYDSAGVAVGIWRGHVAESTLRLVRTFESGFPRDRRGETTSFFAFAMSPDGGFAIGEGAYAYLIRQYDREGNPVGDVTSDVERSTMTDTEYARAMDRRRMALRRVSSLARAQGGNPGLVEDISRERNHFSATALRFDERGRLWVKTDRGGERETIFDVFDSSGYRYDEVTVPVGIGQYDIRDGHLAGLTLRPLDVPIVKVFRLRERRGR